MKGATWLEKPYPRWVANEDIEDFREALLGPVQRRNSDGSPCWCDRPQGHTAACAALYAAWRGAAEHPAPSVTVTCPDCGKSFTHDFGGNR